MHNTTKSEVEPSLKKCKQESDDDTSECDYLTILPKEMLEMITKELDDVSLFMFSRTNRQFLNISKVPIYIGRRAAYLGYLNILKWLKDVKYPLTKKVCAAAAFGGRLEVLKWLRANECQWDGDACACAASEGNLEILQWLHMNGCPWNEWSCASAAMFGQLEILQWLRDNECPWDENTCMAAVDKGHLKVFKWAAENGCPTIGYP